MHPIPRTTTTVYSLYPLAFFSFSPSALVSGLVGGRSTEWHLLNPLSSSSSFLPILLSTPFAAASNPPRRRPRRPPPPSRRALPLRPLPLRRRPPQLPRPPLLPRFRRRLPLPPPILPPPLCRRRPLLPCLRLSASMVAVTLLALGNGAPDAFASAAALCGVLSRTGLAAFVSAFVFGCVAVRPAPFALDPPPFVRYVVFFYLLAVSLLFYIYLSAEIYLWQAIGFVSSYLFFVALVFWMDSGGGERTRDGRRGSEGVELSPVYDVLVPMLWEMQRMPSLDWGFGRCFKKTDYTSVGSTYQNSS